MRLRCRMGGQRQQEGAGVEGTPRAAVRIRGRIRGARSREVAPNDGGKEPASGGKLAQRCACAVELAPNDSWRRTPGSPPARGQDSGKAQASAAGASGLPLEARSVGDWALPDVRWRRGKGPRCTGRARSVPTAHLVSRTSGAARHRPMAIIIQRQTDLCTHASEKTKGEERRGEVGKGAGVGDRG